MQSMARDTDLKCACCRLCGAEVGVEARQELNSAIEIVVEHLLFY